MTQVLIDDNRGIKVSTITPCYKMKNYLKLFLEELPRQHCFEYLEVVLDHNEPSEEEILLVKEFQEKYPNRIRHIIASPVDPIGVSMNRCIQEASGEYLAIWNVDDLRTPDSIFKQIEFLFNKRDYDVVHGNFVIVNKPGLKTGKLVDHSFTIENPKELERGMHLGPFFMFKKEVINKIGYFDEQLKSGADFDFAIRLAKNYKIGMVPGILGYYLDEQKGLSTRGDGVQPIERTMIELRYNILDKISQQYVASVAERGYDVRHMINFGDAKEVG
jgi:glycosyltransferase involved in cell wall biosynthesis